MALTTPIANPVVAWDATKGVTLTFTSIGGAQVVKNKVIIRDNNTNAIVYQREQVTFAFSQEIPSGVLTNGVNYNVSWITFDVNDNQSQPSNIVPFWCYTTPIVTMANIPPSGTITSASYTFEVKYEQLEGEKIDNIIIRLFNASGQEIENSDIIRSTNSPPLTFSYMFTGMENRNTYAVSAIVKTVEGTIVESSRVPFFVSYINPIFYSALILENKCKEGYVQIQSNIKLIDGESYPDPPTYLKNNTKIDLSETNSWVRWTQGYQIYEDFVVGIWLTPVLLGAFCTIGEKDNGYVLSLNREVPTGQTISSDFVSLSGRVNGVERVFTVSNTISKLNNLSDYFVWVKKSGNTYTVKIEEISIHDPNEIFWGNLNPVIGANRTASDVLVGEMRSADDSLIGEERTILVERDPDSNVWYNFLTDLQWGGENGISVGESYTPILNKTKVFGSMSPVFPITTVTLYNGVYDNIDVSSDTTRPYSTEKPDWSFSTLLNCDFDGNINGGNIDVILSQVSGIRVKRRAVGNVTGWVTLFEKDVLTIEDLNFIYADSLIPSNLDLEYALVPIMNGGIEGDLITSRITSVFDGVFVSDGNLVFKLYNGVTYGGTTRNKMIGSLQPIGLRYPVLIENSNVDYMNGSVSGNLYGYTFEETRKINRMDVVKQTQDFTDFLCNGRAKMVYDWNGNIWLVRISQSPQISYVPQYGNGITGVTFNWVEQGKYDNQSDLYYNGFISVRP